jgi:hypothetical protein
MDLLNRYYDNTRQYYLENKLKINLIPKNKILILIKMDLLDLPTIILGDICNYLENKSLCSLIRTCKEIHRRLFLLPTIYQRLDKFYVINSLINRSDSFRNALYESKNVILALQTQDPIHYEHKYRIRVDFIIIEYYSHSMYSGLSRVLTLQKNSVFVICYLLRGGIIGINYGIGHKLALKYVRKAVKNGYFQDTHFTQMVEYFLVKRFEYMALSIDDFMMMLE